MIMRVFVHFLLDYLILIMDSLKAFDQKDSCHNTKNTRVTDNSNDLSGFQQSIFSNPSNDKHKKVNSSSFSFDIQNITKSSQRSDCDLTTPEFPGSEDLPPLSPNYIQKTTDGHFIDYVKYANSWPYEKIEDLKFSEHDHPLIPSPQGESVQFEGNNERAVQKLSTCLLTIVKNSFFKPEEFADCSVNKLSNILPFDIENFKTESYGSLETNPNLFVSQEKQSIEINQLLKPKCIAKEDSIQKRNKKRTDYNLRLREKSKVINQKRGFNKRRKTIACNCRNSHCKNSHCDCHRAGKQCGDKCGCYDCKNELSSINQISYPIEDTFVPIIFNLKKSITNIEIEEKTTSKVFDYFSRRKGRPGKCNCVKSQCNKRYCECFSLGDYCGDSCECSNCVNQQQPLEIKKQHHNK